MENITGIEILIKYSNEDYERFEMKINKRISLFTEDTTVISVDFFNDIKNVIAIIKYKTKR